MPQPEELGEGRLDPAVDDPAGPGRIAWLSAARIGSVPVTPWLVIG